MGVNRDIFLGLGSNLGDREKNLLLAIKKIHSVAGSVTAVSSIYTTQPWGKTDQPEFLNQVIRLESRLTPTDLLHQLLTIETELGRIREEAWGPRTLDIDILFYGRQVINEPGLIVPHPAIPDRKFVLLPLCEIAPLWVHPLLGITCVELLKKTTDPLRVEIVNPAEL